jgi:serine/threonine protein kinase
VIKVLAPELARGLSADRFRLEKQVAASLHHPHIVPLLAAGEAAGRLYYTMPFVAGESLRARLERESELPVSAAVHILADLARALACAHRRGIVHRDIKPENVLLAEGEAQVADFGIARRSLPQPSRSCVGKERSDTPREVTSTKARSPQKSGMHRHEAVLSRPNSTEHNDCHKFFLALSAGDCIGSLAWSAAYEVRVAQSAKRTAKATVFASDGWQVSTAA